MNATPATFLLTALALTGTSFTGRVSAGATETPAQQPPRQVVRFSDLNLSTPVGIRTLYTRIANAAWSVCSDLVPRGNGPSAIKNDECRRVLVDIAVSEVNRPELTALHAGKDVQATVRR
jgi:UrcA family protein